MSDNVGRRKRRSVWCKTDCPPKTPASLASRSHKPGSKPAGSRPPGRSACRRRVCRGRAGLCGRTNRSGRDHSPRRPFFLVSGKSDDPSPSVTKKAFDRGDRAKTRESIFIPETAMSSFGAHGIMISIFAGGSSAMKLLFHVVADTIMPLFLPTHFHEEPLYCFELCSFG